MSPHRFWCVVFISFSWQYILIFLMTFPLTHGLFRSLLFNFQMLRDFPNFGEHTLNDSILLQELRLVLLVAYCWSWSPWEKSAFYCHWLPCFIDIRSGWLTILLKSLTSLLRFSLVVLSTIKSGIFQSPNIIVELTTSLNSILVAYILMLF